MSEKIFLTPEDVEYFEAMRPSDPRFKSRCVTCLEAFHGLWGPDNPPPVGCPYNHARKEDCKEQAIPGAEQRAHIRAIRARGGLPPLTRIEGAN